MGLKLESPISIARGILNDRDPTYRYDDADLLQYANDALDAALSLKPSLFYTEGELQCEVGKALQSVSFDDARSLVQVTKIKGGGAVTLTDRPTLEAFLPSWMTATAAAAEHWLPVLDDPVRFFIYPPAPVAQVLEIIYVRIPGEYVATDDTGLPTTSSEAIADYIIGRAESRDDEHVNSTRAVQFIASFEAKIKA